MDEGLLVELLLLASVSSAAVATGSQKSSTSRFGLGFYALFSSLAVYWMGETTSALIYLLSLGIALTAILAYLEDSYKSVSNDPRCLRVSNRLILPTATAVAFVISYLISSQLIYALSASIALVGLFAVGGRRFFKMVIGLATIEGAFFVVLTKIGLFKPAISVPLCLFLLAGSLGLSHAFLHYRR